MSYRPFLFENILYEDLRVAASQVSLAGFNPPTWELITNDGSVTTGNAYDFTNGSTKGDIPHYAAMDDTTLGISMWIQPRATSGELLDQDGNFEFYLSGGKVTFAITGENPVASNQTLTLGQTYHVFIKARDLGTTTRVKIYINGVLDKSQVVNGELPLSTNGYNLGYWYGGTGWEYDGIIDDVAIYGVSLDDAQVTELYNSGAGIANGHPTGITEATGVIAYFRWEEATGTTVDNACTLGAGFDMALTNGAWVTGLMGVTSGSLGVAGLAFAPDTLQSVGFAMQLPHAYAQGEDIYPHVHFTGKSGSGNVVLGVEYVTCNVHGTYGNTTIVKRVIPVDFDTNPLYHHAEDLPEGGLDGTGFTVSNVSMFRFFRDGTDPLDTFAGNMIFTDFDTHVPVNSAGSRQIWVK